MEASREVVELIGLAPDFVQKHWPKNDTAAKGGAKTPGRGESMVAIGLFITEIADPYIQAIKEEAAISEGVGCMERLFLTIEEEGGVSDSIRVRMLTELELYKKRITSLKSKVTAS